jgi:AraC family transcriptional regulator of adaptative response/methylated-DNA-[protein]-cysteine methyltransferase
MPEPAKPSDPRWAAIVARDKRADGAFLYSVKSTGVYCRPSCASRAAKIENVQFHASAAEAQKAGFRACKRCRPDESPLAERQAALIARLCRHIEGAESTPSLDALGCLVGMSPFYVQRLFKSATGLSPKAYAAGCRAGRIHDTLRRSASVTEAIFDAGFNSSGRFYESSSELLGMTPTDYRAGANAIDIRFAIGECSLGSILVACTNKGVCAILLGDDPDVLARDLQDRFKGAHLIGGDAKFERIIAQVVGLIESPGIGLNLPLDVRGTAFQQRVWLALRAIPPGSTASYTDIAKRIGAPTSCRAVAQACGANALAVAIPCHRVVRNDGGLSGYRWGVDRKRALLDREATR